MQLNQCFNLAVLAIEGGSFLNFSSDHHLCWTKWLLKSTTSFHEHDLNLPWWFGLACLNFSVGGIVMLFTKPNWVLQERTWMGRYKFPYATFALLLIFVQGPLSFMADYVHMANESIFHAADRFLACPLVMLEMSKFFAMYRHTRGCTYVLHISCFIFALFSFGQSQIAQSNLDRELFIFWHTMWHMYPLKGSAIALFDRYVIGEHSYAVMVTSDKQGDNVEREHMKKRRLLSTVVMKNWLR